MTVAEAMVTARMGAEKKDEGNRILASLGSNASKAVNQLYDYLIEERALPFERATVERRPRSKAEIAAAVALVDGLVAPISDEYRDMSLKEARLARLGISAEEAGEAR